MCEWFVCVGPWFGCVTMVCMCGMVWMCEMVCMCDNGLYV